MNNKRIFVWILFLSTTAGNKKSGWEDNNATIAQEQEIQYELLDVEDEKFYRGKKNYILEMRVIRFSATFQYWAENSFFNHQLSIVCFKTVQRERAFKMPL